MRTLSFLVLWFAFTAAAQAADVTVTDAWLRASLGQSPNTAGYMKIKNNGAGEDKLVAVSVAGANMAHVHESAMKDGVMQMNTADMTIKPGEVVELTPGGLHIMVMGAKTAFKAGETVQLRLRFARAGEITVDAQVRGLGAAP